MTTRNNLLTGLLVGAFFIALIAVGSTGRLACDPGLSRAQYKVCEATK